MDIGHPDTPDRPRRPGPLGVRCMGVHACMGVQDARAVPDRWVSDPVRPMVRCTTTSKPARRIAGPVPQPAGPVPQLARCRNMFPGSPARPELFPSQPVRPVLFLDRQPVLSLLPGSTARPVQPARHRNRGTCYWPSAQRPRYVSQQAEERVARPDVWVLPGRGVPEHGNSIGYPREKLEDPLRGFDAPQLSYYIRLFQ
jgi:hypothetical protein